MRFSQTNLLQLYLSIEVAKFLCGNSSIATLFWLVLNPKSLLEVRVPSQFIYLIASMLKWLNFIVFQGSISL